MSVPPLTTFSSTSTTSTLTYQRLKVASVEDNKESDSEVLTCPISEVSTLPVSGVPALPVSGILALPVFGISALSVFGISALPVSGVSGLPAFKVSGLPDAEGLSIAELKKQQLDE